MSLLNLFPCLHFITSSHHLCLISALQLSMLYFFFRQDKAISGISFTSRSSSKNSNNSSGLKSFKVSWANFVVFLLQLLQNSLTCLLNEDIIPLSVSIICKRGEGIPEHSNQTKDNSEAVTSDALKQEKFVHIPG